MVCSDLKNAVPANVVLDLAVRKLQRSVGVAYNSDYNTYALDRLIAILFMRRS